MLYNVMLLNVRQRIPQIAPKKRCSSRSSRPRGATGRPVTTGRHGRRLVEDVAFRSLPELLLAADAVKIPTEHGLGTTPGRQVLVRRLAPCMRQEGQPFARLTGASEVPAMGGIRAAVPGTVLVRQERSDPVCSDCRPPTPNQTAAGPAQVAWPRYSSDWRYRAIPSVTNSFPTAAAGTPMSRPAKPKK